MEVMNWGVVFVRFIFLIWVKIKCTLFFSKPELLKSCQKNF